MNNDEIINEKKQELLRIREKVTKFDQNASLNKFQAKQSQDLQSVQMLKSAGNKSSQSIPKQDQQLNNDTLEQQININTEQNDKKFKFPRLRIITEEEALILQGKNNQQIERQKSLKMLLNLRPEVFEAEDQAEAAAHQKKIKNVVYYIGLAFLGSSLIRIWQLKNKNTKPIFAFCALILCYTPAFHYYNTQTKQYNQFIQRVSQKYQNKIKDEDLQEFQKKVSNSNNNSKQKQ